MNPNNSSKAPLHRIPVYDIRLVQSRRALYHAPLRTRVLAARIDQRRGRQALLAEPTVAHSDHAANAMHSMLGLTDREHFAALFLNGNHHVQDAHIVAVGGQHGITGIEPRTVFRAAIVACASSIVIGHYVPRNIMAVLFPT